MSFDEEKYEKAIPACCKWQRFIEHYEYMLLCWGLCAAIENNEPMLCGECEFATRKDD